MPETIITKQCSRCKEIKALSEFYCRSKTRCGYRAECKNCCSKSTQKYHKTEKGKATQSKAHKKYRKTTKGKAACRKREIKYQKTIKGKVTRNRYRNPNYSKAVNMTNYAVKVGRLPRTNTLQCHYCPNQAEQYHHHKDYEPEHWLDVLPTCIKCHTGIHKNQPN